MIQSIGLSWILVSDMEKAKKLFIEIMGFEIHEENKAYNWLEVKKNNTFLGIWEEKSKSLRDTFSIDPKKNYPGQNAVITFYCNNLKETIEQLKTHAISCEEINTLPNVFHMTTFYDQDNNKFEIFEFINKKF